MLWNLHCECESMGISEITEFLKVFLTYFFELQQARVVKCYNHHMWHERLQRWEHVWSHFVYWNVWGGCICFSFSAFCWRKSGFTHSVMRLFLKWFLNPFGSIWRTMKSSWRRYLRGWSLMAFSLYISLCINLFPTILRYVLFGLPNFADFHDAKSC